MDGDSNAGRFEKLPQEWTAEREESIQKALAPRGSISMESPSSPLEWLARPNSPPSKPLTAVAVDASSRFGLDRPRVDLVRDGVRPLSSLERDKTRAGSHGQSSSVQDPSRDGIANVNRWSQSTSSSRESKSRAHMGSVSRRISFSEYGKPFFGSTLKASLHLRSTKEDLSRHGNSLQTLAVDRKRELASDVAYNLASNGSFPPSQDVVERNLHGTNATLTSSSLDIPPSDAQDVVHDYLEGTWDERAIHGTNVKSVVPSQVSKRQPDYGSGQTSGSSWNGSTLSIYGSQSKSVTHNDENVKQQSHAGRGYTASSKIRNRSLKQPSQKAMLSQALQKANTAVLLDNASNYEGAKESYSEACDLLRLVMARSSGVEDRRKLEAIRNTYDSRIHELERLGPTPPQGGKALPARPEIHTGYEVVGMQESGLGGYITEGTTAMTTGQGLAYDSSPGLPPDKTMLFNIPLQQQGLAGTGDSIPLESSTLSTEEDLMPPVLSIQRLRLPQTVIPQNPVPLPVEPEKSAIRKPSNESMSWLDTIDESDISTTSSVHSRISSPGTLAERNRSASSGTEAEFDAALDAAVEAAYEERPDFTEIRNRRSNADQIDDNDDDVLIRVRRNVEIAKERIRRAEREAALELPYTGQKPGNLHDDDALQTPGECQAQSDDSEEEERMLEEMTRSLAVDAFYHTSSNRPVRQHVPVGRAPIQSIWNPTSTLADAPSEDQMRNSIGSSPMATSRGFQRSRPPPNQELPAIPLQKVATPPTNFESRARNSQSLPNGQGVRSRRLSGQNHKRLKIDTLVCVDDSVVSVQMPPSAVEASLAHGTQRQVGGANGHFHRHHQASSPNPISSPSDTIAVSTLNTTTMPINSEHEFADTQPNSPISALHSHGPLKNFSSSSLRNLNKTLSASADESSDKSAHTPVSAHFRTYPAPMQTRLQTATGYHVPSTTANRENDPATQGGLYLFENDIETPKCSNIIDERDLKSSVHFEPCPAEPLLRPFWLMRALYQTMAHPRGGYLSNKLFVPHDVWRVKGVKLKSLEDKISNCDYLTAALQKVAKVDTYDADAVLVEMQALEGVFEQVQMNLAKKLGSEVGVQGANNLFRDGSGALDSDITATGSKTNQGMTKSSFSWKRLRSKNSALALTSAYSTKLPSNGDAEKDSSTVWSVPITSSTSYRPAFRELKNINFSGPYAHYMAALARLFDAAQILDKVARDADDPGLKHADKTQVGLELSTRHAAEFFGFYICRFVLADVALLLDKFLKRGSEWVVV